ncbi:MAG TPA: NAD(P)H-dependent oxidoreductase [Gammaproteobacteria bacterium]|nr:NAD(P)H-dependent oxidoreductase [Gammaproteobacteria bacterium]
MKIVLKIQASLFGADGQSSKLADRFIEGVRKKHGEIRVVTRDLATGSIPALTLERFQALIAQPEDRSVEQQVVVDFSDALIAELKSADIIVFAVPMYNFNIPAALHNYFDHVARAGVTFRYTAGGPEGLIKGKQVAVFITRGGNYGEDHSQTAFLRQFLSFIGLDDATYFHAEGLAISDESREKSLAVARNEIAKALRPLASAA